MKRFLAALMRVALVGCGAGILLITASAPGFAQSLEGVFNGHRIIIPSSSIPQSGRHHTNYFFVDSDKPRRSPLRELKRLVRWRAFISW